MKKIQSIPPFHKTVDVAKYLVVAFLTIIFLVQLILSFNWRIGYDPSFLHYIAYLINEHGFLPYRDIFEVNFPGTYLFHITIGRMFGYSDLAFRMVDFTWLCAMFTVTWFLMKPVGKMAAFVSCLLFGMTYLGKGPNMSLQRDVFAILPIAIALLIVTRSRSQHSFRLIHILLGGLFALAALVKPHMLIGLPAIFIYNCINFTDRPQSVKKLFKTFIVGGIFTMIGFLPVFAIPFLWLWRIGSIQSFWEIFKSFVPLYGTMSGNFQFLDPLNRYYYLIASYLKFGGFGFSSLFVTSAFGVYYSLTESSSSKTKKLGILLFSLVVLYSIYALIGGKLWNYHWMPYAYFTCLCTTLVLFSPPPFKKLRRSSIFFSLFILIFVFTNPVDRAIPQIRRGNTLLSNSVTVDKISTYLNEKMSPGDKVQPLGWIEEGSVNAMFISRAIPATPYITDFQFYMHVSNPYIQKLRSNFIAELKREMPQFILKMDKKSKLSGIDTDYSFPELEEFIKQNYYIDYQENGFEISKKNDNF